MGTEVGNIFYTVDIDTGAFVRGTREVNKQTDAMAAGFGNAEQALSKLATAIAGVMSIQAVANEFRKAIQVTADFNATISNLSALTGAVGKDLEVFRQAAIDIGGSTSLSASQAAEAMKLIGGAAPDLLKSADALKAVTNDAVILAEAAGVTLPEAATALTATLNQFQLGAEESTRVINVLAAGAKEGSSEIQQTVQVLQNAGVVAAQAGISFEQFNGAVQALAKGEIKGAEAGTALRNIITILNTQVDSKLKPSVVGLSEALANLEAKNLSQTEAVKLFGRENITAASTLLQFRGEMDRVTTAVTGTDEAIRQARTNTDNLKGDIANLSSAYETLQIAIGDLSDGALRDFTQLLTSLLTQVSQNKEAISTFFTGAGIAAQAFAAIIAGRVVQAMYGYTASVVQNTAAQLTSRTAVTGVSAALGMQAKALTTATVAMNAAAIGARGLRTAMALLGGPAGVVLLAGLAVYEYATRARDAKPTTDALTSSISQLGTAAERAAVRFDALLSGVNNLNKQELTVRTDQVEGALKRAESDLKRYERLFEKGNTSVNIGLIEQTKANIQLLRTELEKLRGMTNKEQPASGKPGSVFGGTDTPAAPKGKTEAERQAEAIRDQVAALQLQADTLDMSGSELEIYKLQLAGATDEQIRAAQSSLALIDAFKAQADAAAEVEKQREAFGTDVKGKIVGEVQPLSGGLFDEQSARYEAEAVAENERYAAQLERLKQAKELQLQVTGGYQQLEEQLAAQHAGRLEQIESARNSMMLQTAASTFDSLAGLAQQFAGEQSGIYKVMFAASKAFALADAAIKIQQGIASAAAIPFPANLAAIGTVVAATSSILSTIGSTNMGRQYGGPVTPGGMYRINESGAPEVFNAANGRQYMLPNQKGQVVSNKDAQQNGGSANVQINIVNNTGAQVSQSERTVDDKRVIDIVVGDMMSDGKIARATNQITGTRRPGQ